MIEKVNDLEISYLIGALIGDGCYSYDIKYNNIRVIFAASDKDFVERVKKIIYSNFKINLNINEIKLSEKNKNWRDHYKISSRILYKQLMKYLPDKNKIPFFIKNGDLKRKAAFLSGFFDAEGGISLSTIKSRKVLDRRLHLHSKDINFLNKVKQYLLSFNIDSFIQKGNKAYVLNIWGFKNLSLFQKLIGFKIKRKKDKLEETIKSYKLLHKKRVKELKETLEVFSNWDSHRDFLIVSQT